MKIETKIQIQLSVDERIKELLKNDFYFIPVPQVPANP